MYLTLNEIFSKSENEVILLTRKEGDNIKCLMAVEFCLSYFYSDNFFLHSLFSFYSVSFLVREFFLKGWQWSFYSLWLYQVRNFIFPYIFCTTETKQIGICNGPQFALGAWYYFVNKRWSWPFFPDKSWFVLIYIYCCRYTIMQVSKILFCKKMFGKNLAYPIKNSS